MLAEEKKKKLERFEKTTIMYMVLGRKKRGNPKMFYVRAINESQVRESLDDYDITPIEIMSFVEFVQKGKLDYVPKELRSRKRRKRKKSDK